MQRRRTDTYSCLLPAGIRNIFLQAQPDPEQLQEIRLRTGKPLMICYGGRELGITEDGRMTENVRESYCVSEQDIRETLETVTGYSLYAFDDEIRQGFLTVPGGHRVGVAGKAVREGESVRLIRHISFLNIRLSHQQIGCADCILPYIMSGGELCHTLILSPPGGGKTTLLRDVIRQVSNGTLYGDGKNVGVVDERSELAGAYRGVAQNDLGIRTDVLDGCPKAEGMMMLLRSMSPQIIAVDELGSGQDRYAVENVFYCGCKLLATAHGSSLEELNRNPLLGAMAEKRMFERYVLLGGRQEPGTVRAVLDQDGKPAEKCSRLL